MIRFCLLMFSPLLYQAGHLQGFRADGRLALGKQEDNVAAEGFTVGWTGEKWGHGGCDGEDCMLK